MRAIRPRRRVAPGGWRILRKEAHRFTDRSDAFSLAVVLIIAVLACLCLGSVTLVLGGSGRVPPALQVIDDIRFSADYRHGSTFAAAALAKNGQLFLGTTNNGIVSYRTDSGWQGLWQQYTRASTGNGLLSDSIQGLSTDAQRLWVAANSGLSVANLDATRWQTLIGVDGFAPLGKDAKPKNVRLSPDLRWLATATDQGVGLYDTVAHNWQALTKANGLIPHDRVSIIEFDPLGDLWIGTQAGLVSLRPGDKTSRLELRDQAVVDVAFGTNRIAVLTANGSVLAQAATLGAKAWDRAGQWKTLVGENGFQTAAKLPQDLARAALTDKAIWAVTNTGAIGRYDLATHDWQSYPPLSSKVKAVRDLVIVSETAYVATDVGLFHRFGEKTEDVETLSDVPVRKLAAEGLKVWFLGDDGQVGYADRRATIARAGGRFGPQDGPVLLADVTTYKDYPSELWIAVPGTGIGAYNIDTHAWRSVSVGLPKGSSPKQLITINDSPAALIVDGSRTALYAYKDNRWQRISAANQDVTAIASTDRGLWYRVATGAIYFTTGEIATTGYFENAGPPAQSAAAAALGSRIWTVQNNGNTLWRYDLRSHRWDQFPQKEPISQLVATGDTLLALFKSGQLAVIEPDGTLQKALFDVPRSRGAGSRSSAQPTRFNTAAVYKGTLWLGASTGQVYQYQPSSHTLAETTLSGVEKLYTTASGLWAIASNTLSRFDDGSRNWQPITGLSGIPRWAIAYGGALLVVTDKNTLDWVDESRHVTAQDVQSFQGLGDLTAVVHSDKQIWFGSGQHGLGIYNSDLHTWNIDESIGSVRAITALDDAMLVASGDGVISYSITGDNRQKDFEGDVRGLVRYRDRAWLLAQEKDGYTLYRRDAPGKWMPIRRSSAAPIDLNAITAVAHTSSRFIVGTHTGQLAEYNYISGTWRMIKESLPISRVDWIGIDGDSSTAAIWLSGLAQNNVRRLIQIDARGQATVRSAADHNVTSAAIGADRVWYTELSGGVYFVSESAAATPFTGLLEATPTPIPTFTPTPPGTRSATGTPLLPTITLTPTQMASQRLSQETARLVTADREHLWLATDRAIYQLHWDGRKLEAQHRTEITNPVKQFRVDESGLLIAFSDGSAARLADGALMSLDQAQFDSNLLYRDTQWTWRRNNNALSVTLTGSEIPLNNGRFGFDDFQTLAANASDLWLGGAGGAIKLDESGAVSLYTPPAKGLPGSVQGFRFIQNAWLANLGTAVRRFDTNTKTWQDAASNDYSVPITVAKLGPVQWQATDKAINIDQPKAIENGRFRFDTITAVTTADEQLLIQTPMGVWTSSAPLTWGTFHTDISGFKDAFSGLAGTSLNTVPNDPWIWTLFTDRASGSQTLDIKLRANPNVTRQLELATLEPATVMFADDVVLSVASDLADHKVLWVGTKGGLWKIAADNGQFRQLELIVPGTAVADLRTTDVGLLARVGNKQQLLKGNTFDTPPADMASRRRVLAESDILGSLLEQTASGFTLPNLIETPRRGYWFDQTTAIVGLQDRLWTATAKGLVAYRIGDNSLTAVRFDAWDKLGIQGVAQLQTAPLDPAKPESITIWALDSAGQKALAFVNDQWSPVPLADSPFATQTVTLKLPGQITWTRDGDKVRAALNGRALMWSNGRFDFDDVRDLTLLPAQVWLATAGGPILLQGNPMCKLPTEGLSSINLKRIGADETRRLVVRDMADKDSLLQCDQGEGTWLGASSAISSAVFAPPQVTFEQNKWTIKPGTGKPLAITGLSDGQLFTGKRFSFDAVRDLAAVGDSLWFATAGGSLRMDAKGTTTLILAGLTSVDTRAVRAEDGRTLRLVADNTIFRWANERWTAETTSAFPVTDARAITFDQGRWSAAPLPAPTAPLIAVKDAPPDYRLFVPSGKFSFDDVRDVVNDGASTWLATAGGMVQITLLRDPAGQDNLRVTKIIMDKLCGTADGARIEQGKIFVGYKGRTTGQFLGESCTAMQPWQHLQQVTWAGQKTPLTVGLLGTALVGQRDSNQLFNFTRTEQLVGGIGSTMAMDKAKLVAIIDEDTQTWLVFDGNLVILRKDILRRRGID